MSVHKKKIINKFKKNMKKIFTMLFCLMAIALSVSAQNNEVDETQEVYCMIVGKSKLLSTKLTFTVDYGQSTRYMDGDRKMKMVDDDGNTIKFNSLMDACNYLSSLGWTLFNAYAMVDEKQGTCYHYVFKKLIKKGDVIQINTKGNTPKSKKPND